MRSCMVLVLFLTSGCASLPGAYPLVHSTLVSSDHQGQPLAAREVSLFLASDVIPAACRRVALLRAAPTVTVVDMLRAEAGRLGANAIDLRDFRTTGVTRTEQADGHWNAVALSCPNGGG